MVLDTADPVDDTDVAASERTRSRSRRFEGTKARGEQTALYLFVIVPFLALSWPRSRSPGAGA